MKSSPCINFMLFTTKLLYISLAVFYFHYVSVNSVFPHNIIPSNLSAEFQIQEFDRSSRGEMGREKGLGLWRSAKFGTTCLTSSSNELDVRKLLI